MIDFKNNKTECCGCECCVNSCPQGIIRMRPDPEGFYYPEVTELDKCTDCHSCEKNCPVLNDKYSIKEPAPFAAHMIEDEDLLNSSSGGVATALSRDFIKAGGVVYGVAYDDGASGAHYVRAENESDLECFRGSKYIQSRKNDIYKQIKRDLVFGKKVLFISLPCEAAAIRLYLGKEYDNLYIIDLVCHGPTSEKVAQLFFEPLKRKHGEIESATVRYKKANCQFPFLRAVFSDGFILEQTFYSTDYGKGFVKMSRPSCYACRYKGCSRASDMTIGDFHGADRTASYWNPKGLSLVFVNTEKLKIMFMENKALAITELTMQEALRKNESYLHPIDKPKNRDSFSKYVCRNKLHTAVFKTEPLLRFIKKKIKVLLQYGQNTYKESDS